MNFNNGNFMKNEEILEYLKKYGSNSSIEDDELESCYQIYGVQDGNE